MKNREEVVEYLKKESIEKLEDVFLFVAVRGGKTFISNELADRICDHYGNVKKILITKKGLITKASNEDFKDFTIISYSSLSSKNFGKKLKKGENERSYCRFFKELTGGGKYLVVLDEVHTLKNFTHEVRKFVYPLLKHSVCNIYLTGTPMGNDSLEYLQLLALGWRKLKFKTEESNRINPYYCFSYIDSIVNDPKVYIPNNIEKLEKKSYANYFGEHEDYFKTRPSFLSTKIRGGDYLDRNDIINTTEKGRRFIQAIEEKFIIIKLTEDKLNHFDYSNYENILFRCSTPSINEILVSLVARLSNDKDYYNRFIELSFMDSLEVKDLIGFIESLTDSDKLDFYYKIPSATINEHLNAYSYKHSKLEEILSENKGENIVIWTSFKDENKTLIEKYGFLNGFLEKDRLTYEEKGGIIVMSALSNAEGLNWNHGYISVFMSPNNSSTAFSQARARTMGVGQLNKVKNYLLYFKEEKSILDNMLKKYNFNKYMEI